MLKRAIPALAAASLAAAGLAVTAPAHAAPGPELWARPYASGTLTAETIDCKTIVVTETRTDRATRFYRVENRFPAPSTANQFPNQQRARMALPAVQHGWNVVRAWTTATPGLDQSVVVWVPDCAADLNPQTCPKAPWPPPPARAPRPQPSRGRTLMPLHGIDISNHNHPIDPTAVPGSFVIMRASEGKGMRDPHFPGYDAKVRPSNRLAGAYHFCWVGDATGIKNTPQAEAANFAAAVKDHLRPGFLLVCDWEPRHHGRNTDWAVDFALEVKRLTGRTPILYANWSTLNGPDWSRWRREIGGGYWLAGGTGQYDDRTDGYVSNGRPNNPAGWGDPVMHQFTEMGYLPGWSGRLDLNEFYGTAADWRALADGTVTPPKEPPKETPVTNRTIRGFKVSEDAYWSFLALEELAVLKGWCKRTLDIYQGTGYSSKSGGTHAPPGGAMDFWQSSNPRALLHAARNGGFPGWHRTPAQGFGHHVHAGTNLPGRPYSYQLAALKAGYNGLGSGGYGGKDDGPRDGVTFRNWKAGLEWLRAEIEKEKAKIEKEKAMQKAPATADAPAAPRAIQTLPDYWNPWIAVDAWDNANPADATLTGLSDVQLRELFIAHGFMFYNRGSLHEDMRFTLADFAAGLALENIPRNPDQVAWDLLQQITRPITGVTWVELRPIFDAAHAGGGFGTWGEQRTRHSVRAVQSGLNHLSGATLIPEDGIYSTVTRRAVANFQVQMRGATAGTPAADGVVGLHDALHLVRLCSERVGRPHRLRFCY